MAAWLVKEEPTKYTWEQFMQDKRTCWDKVRNYMARNHLREMKKGDEVVFYHSMSLKSAMGVAKVVKTAYPDPSAEEGDWSAVDLEFVEAFAEPVTLKQVKADPVLVESELVRLSRVSVVPLTAKELARFRKLGKGA